MKKIIAFALAATMVVPLLGMPVSSSNEVPTETHYLEDFTNPDVITEIKEGLNGWSHNDELNGEGNSAFRVEIAGKGSPPPSGKSPMRFIVESAWYKTLWMNLNFEENGIHKKIQEGKSQEVAEAEVAEYLSSDVAVSFVAKFGSDEVPEGQEQYVRIKSETGEGAFGLLLKGKDLYLVALNEGLTQNVAYLIEADAMFVKDEPGKWYDFRVFFNMEEDTYKLVVNGETFTGTPFGEWIPISSGVNENADSFPADINGVSAIEFGHFWSGWWPGIYVDEIKISAYSADFAIDSIVAKDQMGSTKIDIGDTVEAEVITKGLPIDDSKTLARWEYSADSGRTWSDMGGNVVPDDANRIRLTVTAESIYGQVDEMSTIFFVFGSEVAITPAITVDFQGEDALSTVQAQRDGWAHGGDEYEVLMAGDADKYLRFRTYGWGKDSRIAYNFDNAQLSNSPQMFSSSGAQRYLSFDLMIDSEASAAQYYSSARLYVKINDVDGNSFATLYMQGTDLYFIYYDAEARDNKKLLLSSGLSNIIKKWNTIEMYVDADSDSYSMLINGEYVEGDYGKWIRASRDHNEGSVAGPAKDITDVGSIEFEMIYATWGTSFNINNINLGSYELKEGADFSVENIEILNQQDPGLEVVYGCQVMVEPEIIGSPLAGAVYTWSYLPEGGSSFLPMSTNTVPSNASRVRVSAQLTSVYGQKASGTAEIDVFNNQPPSISNLQVIGNFEAGTQLECQYDFVDEHDVDLSRFQWYKGKSVTEMMRITGATKSTYMVQQADEGGFLSLEVTPYDKYGVAGEVKRVALAHSERMILDAVLALLTIDLSPTGNSMVLPTDDSISPLTFGAEISWESGNKSVISNTGQITKPQYNEEVVMTATVRRGSVSERKIYRVNVAGIEGARPVATPKPVVSGSSGSSGSGGSGGVGSAVRGTVPTATPDSTPIPTPVPTSAPEKLFSDVDMQAWYSEYVVLLANKGIISTSADNFRPNDNVTRAEFVKMVVEAFGFADQDARVDFSDVNEGEWDYIYIASAFKAGLVNGYGDGLFGKNESISRQDMSVIIYRAMKMTQRELQTAHPDFDDNHMIADYAIESIGAMQAAGILNGSEGVFNPRSNATRAETAKVISAILE